MKNVLDIQVSYFRRCTSVEQPVSINLLDYLQSSKHQAIIETIRQEPEKERRDQLKKEYLPGITPSGIFTHRSEQGLVQHSGLIAGDIDFKDNPFTPATIKKQLMHVVNIAYCGLSASGQGLWFLAPIADPSRHKAHFAAMRNDFLKLGILLDPAPGNVASFRFYSFDPDGYFNPHAVPYTRIYTPPAPLRANPPQYATDDPFGRLEDAIQQIEKAQQDIAPTYAQWFRIGCALAGELGEQGRSYFHRISQLHHRYHPPEVDRQFDKCLRWKGNRIGLGTVFYWVGMFQSPSKKSEPVTCTNVSDASAEL